MMIVTVTVIQQAFIPFLLDALVTMDCQLIIQRNVPPHWLLLSTGHLTRKGRKIRWYELLFACKLWNLSSMVFNAKGK